MCCMEHPIAATKEKELLYKAERMLMKQMIGIAGVKREQNSYGARVCYLNMNSDGFTIIFFQGHLI